MVAFPHSQTGRVGALLERYRPNGTATIHGAEHGQLLIKRDRPVRLERAGSRHARGHLGQWIDVPRTADGTAVFVKTTLGPTTLGRIRDTAWRPPLVFITLRLADGTEVEHRFLPSVASAGFLLSPYASSSDVFGAYYDGGRGLRRVESFRLSTDGKGDYRFWEAAFDAEFDIRRLPAKDIDR